jgi:hypothetical protein
LLAGLLRCGRCVNVQYHAWGPACVCSYEKTNYGTGTSCQHISAHAGTLVAAICRGDEVTLLTCRANTTESQANRLSDDRVPKP